MFSKEAIKLAKPLIEAIKTIAERQEKECPECKGRGLMPTEYIATGNYDDESTETCRECNGLCKVKGKWEWEPRWNELALLDGTLVSIRQHWLTSDKRKVCRVAGKNEKSFTVMKEKLLPILLWERIEEILEGMGYFIRVQSWSIDNKRLYRHEFYAEIWNLAKNNREYIVSQHASTTQQAVQKAVIELGGKA